MRHRRYVCVFGVCSHQWPCFPAQPSLFQPDETYKCITQDVLSSPVSFAHEEKGCTTEVISMEITTPASDSTKRRVGGAGASTDLALCTSLSPWETASIK